MASIHKLLQLYCILAIFLLVQVFGSEVQDMNALQRKTTKLSLAESPDEGKLLKSEFENGEKPKIQKQIQRYCRRDGSCTNLKLITVPKRVKKSIQNFALDKNKIVRIDKNSFKNYPNLTSIDLNRNVIEFVEEGSFDYLDRLVILDLSENKLTKFLQPVPRLGKLILYGNPDLGEINVNDYTKKHMKLSYPKQNGIAISFINGLDYLVRKHPIKETE